jgi:hypothetical protein
MCKNIHPSGANVKVVAGDLFHVVRLDVFGDIGDDPILYKNVICLPVKRGERCYYPDVFE